MRREIIGNSELYLGDCRDLMSTLTAIEAVVTDPPYGVNLNTKTASSSRHRGGAFGLDKSVDALPVHGDNAPFDPSPFTQFHEAILWGGNHFCSRLPDASKWLVWDKRCGGTPDDNADCEIAWTNLKGPARIHRQVWRGFFRQGVENASISGAKVHPTQKPIALMDWCVSMIAGSVILDPFMGSGTTGVACAKAGKHFIGVEIESRYFDIACKRIDQAQRQGDMFVQPAEVMA